MPHQKTPAELQEYGQVLYKRKEYAKALEQFTEAINSSSNLTVSLLDNRAATHEKLEDITSALKDAKSTIRVGEKNPTGYLRAGRLLQKAGKHDIALGIYKRAIKLKVTNVEVLVKLHDRLLRSTAPPTAADPFAQLPIELVEMILAHLSFRQVVNCTRVSKQWNTFIASLPNLWTNLDLSEAKKPVKNNFISHCINRSNRKITIANLKLLNGSDKAITALIRHCKHMHSLSILDGGVRSLDFVHQLSSARTLTKIKLGVQAPMGLDSVSQLLREVTNLTHVEILGVVAKNTATWAVDLPTLSTLTLASVEPHAPFPTLHLSSLLQRTPNLRNLTVANFRYSRSDAVQRLDLQSHCPKLQKLDFSRSNADNLWLPVTDLPHTIRALHLYGGAYPSNAFGQITPSSFFLPCLEELTVHEPAVANLLLSTAGIIDYVDATTKTQWQQNPAIMAIFRKPSSELSNLRYLKMELGDSWGSDQFPLLVSSSRLSTLQHLLLKGTRFVNDDVAELIALNMTNLITLDLSASGVTGYGVKKIVESCSKLKVLVLNECELCSGDAIEWARGKGVRVDFAITTNKFKGRKVRSQ